MSVYYNEFNPKKAAALRQLIYDGFLPEGWVDERDIKEVKADELREFNQHHFFAGYGGWAFALEIAGWAADRPVWTGSCPCQPFSDAGSKKGKADDRHLWPEWFRLIEEFYPSTIFGEQVKSAIAEGWLDDVYQGLEAANYAVGAIVLPASAVGAPHRRERLWIVADSDSNGLDKGGGGESASWRNGFDRDGYVMGNTFGTRLQRHSRNDGKKKKRRQSSRSTTSTGFWDDAKWLQGPDGKYRAVKPGIELLVNGYIQRSGLLHAAGDGIVPQEAAEIIKAFMQRN